MLKENKQCNICKHYKPVSEFYVESKNKDGLTSRCKECCKHSRVYKKHYENTHLKTYAEYLENYKEVDKSKYNKK